MTRQEIKAALDRTGIYYDQEHPDHISADKLDTLPPPFMEWGTEEIRIRADGLDYVRYKKLTVIIYTDTDEENEEEWEDHNGEQILDNDGNTIILIEHPEEMDSVERVLQDIAGSYKKEISYNDGLSLYELRYTTEV